jgi:hypothetical protein
MLALNGEVRRVLPRQTGAEGVACQSQGTTPLPEAWDHFAPRNDRLAR